MLGNVSLGQSNVIPGQGSIEMATFQAASKLFDPTYGVSACYSDYQVP